MSKVIFELKDGTKKEFDGEKFTDKQVTAFNTGGCRMVNCGKCPFNSDDCVKARGFHSPQVARCYRVTEESKPVQILKRLIEGGSVWVDGEEVKIKNMAIEGKYSYHRLDDGAVTLEKPKKKIKVERWINIYPNGWVVMHDTKCEADKWSGGRRIACEHFVREYEI